MIASQAKITGVKGCNLAASRASGDLIASPSDTRLDILPQPQSHGSLGCKKSCCPQSARLTQAVHSMCSDATDSERRREISLLRSSLDDVFGRRTIASSDHQEVVKKSWRAGIKGSSGCAKEPREQVPVSSPAHRLDILPENPCRCRCPKPRTNLWIRGGHSLSLRFFCATLKVVKQVTDSSRSEGTPSLTLSLTLTLVIWFSERLSRTHGCLQKQLLALAQ